MTAKAALLMKRFRSGCGGSPGLRRKISGGRSSSCFQACEAEKNQNRHKKQAASDGVVGLLGYVFERRMAEGDAVIDDQDAEPDEVEEISEQNAANDVRRPAAQRNAFEITEDRAPDIPT